MYGGTIMTEEQSTFDVIIFSGGGFKGAYGAGAAKAILSYYKLMNINRSLCFVGNSAGALNAAVLASSSADDLIKFWLEADPKQVLGHSTPGSMGVLWRYLQWTFSRKRKFFSVFSGEPLKAFINKAVSFEKIEKNDKHLIIVATDSNYADVRAFFSSKLMMKMLEADRRKEFHARRLKHWDLIDSQEKLVLTLQGSTAIPLAFPPVEIEYSRQGSKVKSYFVDGGVGNNIPTREAAYFHRLLKDLGLGIPGDTFCIKLSQDRIVADDLEHDPFSILLRTFDVYDEIHMGRIVAAWHRINREIDDSMNRIATFNQFLDAEIQDPVLRDRVKSESQRFNLRQHKLRLFEIKPTGSLGGTLDFSRDRIRNIIKMGHDDAVKMLTNQQMITPDHEHSLITEFRLPGGQ